jgi:hypothetical protein
MKVRMEPPSSGYIMGLLLGPVCFSFYLASASQKPEAETNSLAFELAFEKLESWLPRKRTTS